MVKTVSTLNKKNIYLDALFLFLISRVFFIVIIVLGSQNPFGVFTLFDAEHYLNIAEFGYYHESVTAFFPMIPVLIRAFSVPGTLIINNLCFYGSLLLLNKLNISKVMRVIFAISPIGFFSMLLYTEGVFVFLTLAAWYLFVNRRAPLLMGVFIGLSVMTRSTGSLLFFSIFVGMCISLARHKTTILKIIEAYVPATVLALAYPVYLQLRFGNWKLFMDVQYDYWIRIKSNVFKTTLMSIKMAFTNGYPFEDFEAEVLSRTNEILTLLIFGFTVGLIVKTILEQAKTRKFSTKAAVLVIYAILTIIALDATVREPNLDAPTISFYRYYFAVLSLYVLGDRLKPESKRILVYLTFLISVVTSFLFCKGVYFY